MSMPLSSPASGALSRARIAQRTGRLEDARRLFAEGLKASPRDVQLLLEAGVLEGQLGNMAGAERLLSKALKLDPLNADVHYNLGQVAREDKELERAVRCFRKALELDPAYADAAFALGEALYVQGKAEEALKWLERASAEAPNDPEIVHLKALCFDHLGRTPAAIQAYRDVLRMKADHVNATFNLAVLTARLADPLEALEVVNRFEAKAAVPPDCCALAAKVLNLAGENERAFAYAEKAIAAGKSVSEATNTLANIMIDAGEFDAAEAELRKVVKLRNDPTHAYYRLSIIKRLEPEAETTLKQSAENDRLSVHSRSAAYFALYNLFDQAGRCEEAFEMLAKANVLKGGKIPFDLARHETQTSRIIAAYTPDFLAARRPYGFGEPGTIFVVGMPRSGTTLTEQILAAHPAVHAGGEGLNVSRAVVQPAGWPEEVNADPAAVHEQGRVIHQDTFAPAGGKPFATDKTPGNFMLLGPLFCALPRAKLIYVRREPGDNAMSLYEQSFLRGLGYSYDLAKIGGVYREHLRIMNHWLTVCRLPIHAVHYDALVADPEPHIRALLEFVGLDFHPGCLTPERVERPIKTSSVWQVRQPISAKSVGRWRRYERQMQPFFRALEGAP